jgi:hypothetical protein
VFTIDGWTYRVCIINRWTYRVLTISALRAEGVRALRMDGARLAAVEDEDLLEMGVHPTPSTLNSEA